MTPTPGKPVREYAKRHWKRVRFFQYIQWVASGQLNEIQRMAEHLAMPIGLYHDLALGTDRDGAEAWIYQSALAFGADSGAPPDAFAPEGQNWGLPPINPHALRASRARNPLARLLTSSCIPTRRIRNGSSARPCQPARVVTAAV